MGNYYILVALSERKYITFLEGSKEIELFNIKNMKLVLGFLRLYDQGYGGGEGMFAFIGDEWTPHLVIDRITGKKLNWDYIHEHFKDVTEEVIEDLKESGVWEY